MKNPLTPAGIEPATYWFVAQHLNHCATAVPSLSYVLYIIISPFLWYTPILWLKVPIFMYLDYAVCINTQTVCGVPYLMFSCVLSLICAVTPSICVTLCSDIWESEGVYCTYVCHVAGYFWVSDYLNIWFCALWCSQVHAAITIKFVARRQQGAYVSITKTIRLVVSIEIAAASCGNLWK